MRRYLTRSGISNYDSAMIRQFRTLGWVFLFAVAMGFLESAVVVYLRAIYYPGGFAFPLGAMTPLHAVTELFREAATMVMLVSVAALAARRLAVAVAWFIFAFAVWDIFYYLFLYLLMGWPSTLMTWDILFLIPVMWTGPVLAPVINSLTMILLAMVIITASEKHETIRLKGVEWSLLIAGAVITIIGYTADYLHFMGSRFSLPELAGFSNYQEVLQYSSGYIPAHFSWWIFWVGEALFLVATGLFYLRHSRD